MSSTHLYQLKAILWCCSEGEFLIPLFFWHTSGSRVERWSVILAAVDIFSLYVNARNRTWFIRWYIAYDILIIRIFTWSRLLTHASVRLHSLPVGRVLKFLFTSHDPPILQTFMLRSKDLDLISRSRLYMWFPSISFSMYTYAFSDLSGKPVAKLYFCQDVSEDKF